MDDIKSLSSIEDNLASCVVLQTSEDHDCSSSLEVPALIL